MLEKNIDEIWNDIITQPYKCSQGPEWLCRGVADETYELIPSIGRGTKENIIGGTEGLESDLMREFRRLTLPLLDRQPESEFDWLFLAQHYGLPTRLLDWSSNPLVGLYFATEKHDDKDGALYSLQHMVTDQYELFDYCTADYTKVEWRPIGLQPDQGNVIFVRPRYGDKRYINQRSVFSCPKDPFVPLQLADIRKVIIPARFKAKFRERLRVLGVASSFIYPGLEGVTAEVKSFLFDPIASGRRKRVDMHGKLELPVAAVALTPSTDAS